MWPAIFSDASMFIVMMGKPQQRDAGEIDDRAAEGLDDHVHVAVAGRSWSMPSRRTGRTM